MNFPVVQSLGAESTAENPFGLDYGEPQGATGSDWGTVWENLLYKGTNILDRWLNPAPAVQQSTDTQMVDRLLAQAKANQMILLGGGALVAVALIGYKLLGKK